MKLHVVSFKHAFEGIFYVFHSQPNFRIHSLIAFLTLSLSWIMGINHLEWIIILFTIILVFTTEMLNTAVESMTDLITTEHHQAAKIAKDVSAGMVLIAALGAIVVGLVIFTPYLFALL